MIRTVLVFILGVFFGQEYGDVIPSVKVKTYEAYQFFIKTDLYKKINEDLKKD